jgi:hypothetical protein
MAAGPGAALATAATLRVAGEPDPAAEMKSLGARAARGGIFLTILVVLIVSLMAGKPAI